MNKTLKIIISSALVLSLSACGSAGLEGKSQAYKDGFEVGQGLDVFDVVEYGTIDLCTNSANVRKVIHYLDDDSYLEEEFYQGCMDGYDYASENS